MFKRLVVLCLCVLLLPARVAAQHQGVIHLQAEAWVEGQTVLLGHIASFEGDAELTEALVEVNVGSAPLPGTSRRLTVGQIEVRLRQAGINPRDVEITGAAEVMVYRGAAQPSPEHGVHEEGYPVVVAAREISRLQIIAASDLEIRYESRPGAAWNSGELEDFVGKRATRHFPSGAVLTLTGVEVPPLIERGTPVVIVSEVGGIKVSAPGVARAAGGLGEIIPVENTISKQVVYGEIMDAETVRVMVGGQ
ncbi:MAG TPA: flagellar basal body P-ring formation protein FlgA [Firmicutes bacterium]|jgi:flagella basal body P-ring formation protein FlgA|nr:flagellar basal body P-ring formation protein FlgA [Bacillota bacterium]